MGLDTGSEKLEKYSLIFFYSVKAVKLGTYCTYGVGTSTSRYLVGSQVFLCPRGQGVGGAPNVHESPR